MAIHINNKEYRLLTMLDLSYIIQDMTDEIETVKWDSKEYKMPFKADYFKQKADKFKELIIVRNRFSMSFSLGVISSVKDLWII